MDDKVIRQFNKSIKDSDEDYLNKVIIYVNKHKGKKIPIDKFKDLTEGVLIGYDTSCALFIIRVPKTYGWTYDVFTKDDVIVYNRFKLSNYTYAYLSAFNFIYQ